jgi:hypothetical protein
VFAQTGRGLYKSLDGGINFAPLAIGVAGATATATPMLALSPGYREAGPTRTAYAAVLQIFNDPAHPERAHNAGGVYRSTDGGATWARVDSSGLLGAGTTAVAVAPDGRLFAGYLGAVHASSGLLCSVDGGKTWRAACPSVVSSGGSNAAGRSDGAASAQPCSGRAAGACSDTHAVTGAVAGAQAPPGDQDARGQGESATPAVVRQPQEATWRRAAVPVLIAAALLAALSGASAAWRRRRATASPIDPGGKT